MTRAQTVPIYIGPDNDREPLVRCHLGAGAHDEDWLQALIHDHPEMLPVADIEPGFDSIVAAAREVPCGHGFIDNLYITPSGDIVLVETKLWRNSQMRREVVAQALDYVAALTAMTYEAFEQAILKGIGAPARLYDLVADRGDALEEARFIDAISLNLERGRMLVMVVGDGIRTETEALTGLLQSHAGAHFTFALVELAIWKHEANGTLVAVPNILARTLLIERGIVRIEKGQAVVAEPAGTATAKAQSISLRDFWDSLAEQDPALPAAVQSFIDALEPLGVYTELRASLNFKADLADRDRPVNFGYITRGGQFWPNPAAWSLPKPLWMPYFELLASLVGGRIIDEPGSKFVAVNGRSVPRIGQFLPQHQEVIVNAIKDMLRKLAVEEQ